MMLKRTRMRPAISPVQRGRTGFTLIELMVSVTLAIIILGMFAALYQWTTETYTDQKGNRRNDQRSRMLSIVMRADLENRSFQYVVPFVPGQDTRPGQGGTDANYNADFRQGYFSISENDPDNHTDDVLAFVTLISTNDTQTPYLGKATLLTPPNQGDAGYNNQPEFDDGDPTANSIGASRAAEVVYFLRNGNLYRRQLLIREPYDGTVALPPAITGDYNATTFPPPTSPNGIFWEDFDYSAFYHMGLQFHGIDGSLINENPSTAQAVDGLPPVLGIPYLRYGGSLNRFNATPPMPFPREYVDNAGNPRFIGRFLAQETAHPDFGYPGGANDPHDPATVLNYDNATGLVTELSPAAGGATPAPRRGEEILMTNVHEFDVKVWDSRLNRFVDLGHNFTFDDAGTPVPGDYNRERNLLPGAAGDNVRTGTGPWEGNRYDTWHPFGDAGNQNSGLGPPPYKPGTTGGNPAALGSADERPLRAIQIRIRFFDVPTQKMRQLTLIHRLKLRD